VRAAAAQPEEFVTRHRYADGERGIAPLGQQCVHGAGLQHRAGQGMCADGGAFFQDTDRELGLLLLEPDGGSQARGSAADHGHVVLHHIALCGAG
jgi:hypothetical protein